MVLKIAVTFTIDRTPAPQKWDEPAPVETPSPKPPMVARPDQPVLRQLLMPWAEDYNLEIDGRLICI